MANVDRIGTGNSKKFDSVTAKKCCINVLLRLRSEPFHTASLLIGVFY